MNYTMITPCIEQSRRHKYKLFYEAVMATADIRIQYHKDDNTFYAYHMDLEIFTDGGDFDDAVEMIKDCTMIQCEGAVDDGWSIEDFRNHYGADSDWPESVLDG